MLLLTCSEPAYLWPYTAYVLLMMAEIVARNMYSKATAENQNAIVASCWTYFTTISCQCLESLMVSSLSINGTPYHCCSIIIKDTPSSVN